MRAGAFMVMAFASVPFGAMAQAAGDPVLTPDVAAYADRVDDWLLAGDRLPADYRLDLMAMQPADRMQAIIYLRRAGFLNGADAWPMADLLRPAPQPAQLKDR